MCTATIFNNGIYYQKKFVKLTAANNMDIPYTEHMMCDLTINDTIVTNSVIYVLKNILKRKKSVIEYGILRTNLLVSVPNSHTFKV